MPRNYKKEYLAKYSPIKFDEIPNYALLNQHPGYVFASGCNYRGYRALSEIPLKSV